MADHRIDDDFILNKLPNWRTVNIIAPHDPQIEVKYDLNVDISEELKKEIKKIKNADDFKEYVLNLIVSNEGIKIQHNQNDANNLRNINQNFEGENDENDENEMNLGYQDHENENEDNAGDVSHEDEEYENIYTTYIISLDELQVIKQILKDSGFSNLTILPNRIKFQSGDKRSIKEHSQVLKTKITNNRIIFFHKLEDEKVIDDIKAFFNEGLKDGSNLSHHNKKFSNYYYCELPCEIFFNFNNLGELISHIVGLYVANVNLLNDKNPYKKRIKKFFDDDANEVYIGKYYLYLKFNYILNQADTFENRDKFLSNKRKREENEINLNNTILVEFPKIINRKFQDIMSKNKVEFFEYLKVTANEKGFNNNINFENLLNKFKNDYESFFENIGETIKRMVCSFDNLQNYPSQLFKEKLEMLKIFSTLGSTNNKQNDKMIKCLDFIESYLK